MASNPNVFQHAAARRRLISPFALQPRNSNVSTRSRPKAAELLLTFYLSRSSVSTRSRPKAAELQVVKVTPDLTFQHAAARRRLK